MIRINLMPAEERAQKARRVRAGGSEPPSAGLLLPVASLAAVVVLLAGVPVQQQARIHRLASEVARVEQESRAHAPQSAMVERLSRERADLEMRLSLIYRLSRGRFDSVRLMDELDRAVP